MSAQPSLNHEDIVTTTLPNDVVKAIKNLAESPAAGIMFGNPDPVIDSVAVVIRGS